MIPFGHERVAPGASSNFEIELLNGNYGDSKLPVMGLGSTTDGKVLLRGSTGVELASALNWYLQDYCNSTYDWSTYQPPRIPDPLPLPPKEVIIRHRTTKYSYYMNVCTYGYSLAFVNWEYWQKHIDWMLLNGINMPLAFVGQEYVWMKLFTSKTYGLTNDDMWAFFAGPAFLPWGRMGNIRGWAGGTMSPAGMLNWINERKNLNIQILKRMRSFGMEAALTGFGVTFLQP